MKPADRPPGCWWRRPARAGWCWRSWPWSPGCLPLAPRPSGQTFSRHGPSV